MAGYLDFLGSRPTDDQAALRGLAYSLLLLHSTDQQDPNACSLVTTAKVGFGLWRHVLLSFPLELIVLGLGAGLDARAMTFASAKGRYAFLAFVFFLAVLQIYANFGPPPSSPEIMAATALAFYLVLALLAAVIERIATSRPI